MSSSIYITMLNVCIHQLKLQFSFRSTWLSKTFSVILKGLGTLWDFNLTLKGLGTVFDFNMTFKGLGPLWVLNTTLFWRPSADAGLRETDKQSVYTLKTKLVFYRYCTSKCLTLSFRYHRFKTMWQSYSLSFYYKLIKQYLWSEHQCPGVGVGGWCCLLLLLLKGEVLIPT